MIGTVLRGAEAFDEFRILLMPDHATPTEVRTHTSEPVPFVIFDSRSVKRNEGVSYDESISLIRDRMIVEDGHRLMDYFIKGE